MTWKKKISKAVSKAKKKFFPTIKAPKIKEPFLDRMGRTYSNNRPLLIFATTALSAYVVGKSSQQFKNDPSILINNRIVELASGLKDKFAKPQSITMPNITTNNSSTYHNSMDYLDRMANRFDPSKIATRAWRRR